MTDLNFIHLEAKDIKKAIEALKKNGVGQNGCQVVLDANKVYQIMLENERLRRKPDPDTGLKGCWHCRNIEAHHIEYVIAVKAKGGTPMNMPVDCPYHYCPACGRKLEVDDD